MNRLFAATALAMQALTALAVNPIITHKYSADPNAFVWNDRLYVMCSHDTDNQEGFDMHDYILLSTDDLVNWTDHGDVFKGGKDVSWCWNLYAPGLAMKNGKFYLYFPNAGGPIGVAVADRPEGPYVDPLGKPLIAWDMPGCDSAWVFDPAAFVDDDGEAYLYFGGNGESMARGIRLNSDMISAQFPAVTLKASKDGNEATGMPSFFEASYMHKHNGKYYFSYSANFPDRGASIDYAIGDSPLGPFEWKGAMLPNFNDNWWNNNHASVVEFRGKSYILYHSRLLTGRIGHGLVNERSVSIDELRYNDDGTIVPVVPTHEGPKQLKPLDPFRRNLAATICEDSGVEVTMAGNETSKQSVVTVLGDGSWLRYAGFHADAVPERVTVRCRAYDSATLEIRKFAVDGELIASVAISDTDRSFRRFTAPVRAFGAVDCDLYFVFKGAARGVEFADYMFTTGGAEADFGDTPAIDDATPKHGVSWYRKGLVLVDAVAAAAGEAKIGPFRSAGDCVSGWDGVNTNEGVLNRRDYNLDAWADDAVYKKALWSWNWLSVTIDNLKPGVEYVVEWHCAEAYFGVQGGDAGAQASRAFSVYAGSGASEDMFAKAVAEGVEFSDGKMIPGRPYCFWSKATADAEGKITVRAERGALEPVFSALAVWGPESTQPTTDVPDDDEQDDLPTGNGLLMKVFEFGDAGVCAANFIERNLDWSGASVVSGFEKVNTTNGWKKGMMVAYRGYIWNRSDSDVNWVFFESFDSAAMLKIDGKIVLNDGRYENTTLAAVVLSPGAHSFEARFASYGDNGGPSTMSWQGWNGCPGLGFAVNWEGNDNYWIPGNYDPMSNPDVFTANNPGGEEYRPEPEPYVALCPQRGRPVVANGTMLTESGRPMRGCCITTTNDGNPPTRAGLATVRDVGLNVVHYYAECSPEGYVSGSGGVAPGYSVKELDRAVALTRELGLYLVLNLYEPPGTYNYDWAMDFWKFYAARYKDETHVIYEIHNEPVSWSPPYAGKRTIDGQPDALQMNVDLFKYIRSVAPDTPVLLFSYSVIYGELGRDIVSDVTSFEQAVGGGPADIWSNACIAFHGYGGALGTREPVLYLKERGYPLFMAEYYSAVWGEGPEGVDNSILTGFCEDNGISWMSFLFTPPAPWGHDITDPARFANHIDAAGIGWMPDYGEWPRPRAPFSGESREIGLFKDGRISDSMTIWAEEFDVGANGVTYFDTTRGNAGGGARTETDADIRNVGGTIWVDLSEGEWVEYTFLVQEAGYYNVTLRTGSRVAGSVIDMTMGFAEIGKMALPQGDNAEERSIDCFLPVGRQKLRVKMTSGSASVDWVRFSPVTSGIVPDGDYLFVNRETGLQLVNGNGGLVQGEATTENAGVLELKNLGAGQYRITSKVGGVLQRNWSSGDSAGFVGWGWDYPEANQRWILRPADDGMYLRLACADDGHDFSVAEGGIGARALQSISRFGGELSRQWIVTPAGGPSQKVRMRPGDTPVTLEAQTLDEARHLAAVGYEVFLSDEDVSAGLKGEYFEIGVRQASGRYALGVDLNPASVRAPHVAALRPGVLLQNQNGAGGRRMSIRIENALKGLWYGIESTDDLMQPFADDDNSYVRAAEDGSLVLETTGGGSQAFFRAKVLPALDR